MNPTTNSDSIDHLFDVLEIILTERKNERMLLVGIKNIIEAAARRATDSEFQVFANTYARLLFLHRQERIQGRTLHQVLEAMRLGRSTSVAVGLERVHSAARAAYLLLVDLCGTPPTLHEDVQDIINKANPFPPSSPAAAGDSIAFVAGQIVDIVPGTSAAKPRIVMESIKYGILTIELSEEWQYLAEQAEQFMSLHCFCLGGERYNRTTHDKSILVLEPDMLFDASEIAKYSDIGQMTYTPYIVSKLTANKPSLSMVRGSIINELFDEIARGNDVSPEEAVLSYFKKNPLSLLAIMDEYEGNKVDGEEQLKAMKTELPKHAEVIREVMSTITADEIYLEPSFISPIYGIQGRLDALLAYSDEENNDKKDIIELKSGNVRDGAFMWPEHRAQVLCYDLLLEQVWKKRKGESMILYSKDTKNPLRNTALPLSFKKNVLHARNFMVSCERLMYRKGAEVFRFLSEKLAGQVNSFDERKLSEIRRKLANLDAVEKLYLDICVKCVAGESHTQRLGSSRNEGTAALWQASLATKKERYSVLSHLRVLVDECDFDKMYIVLEFTLEEEIITSMRIGDTIIAYQGLHSSPDSSDGYAEVPPTSLQLFKGTLRSISNTRVEISLRNKMLPRHLFGDAQKLWCIEPDTSFNDRTLSRLMDFVDAKKERRDIALGRKRPSFSTDIEVPDASVALSDEQKVLLQRAIASNDLFLLQGPPGTGKTSRMIRSIVEYYFRHKKETKVLLLAYTNRAADEICSAVEDIAPKFPFLRYGSSTSSRHQKHLTSTVFNKNKDIGTIREFFGRTQFLVLTVSSYLGHPEIASVFKADVVLIDEASQLLEPHIIGIVSSIPKCILIGDEKQLAAVVTQEKQRLLLKDERLTSLEIKDFSESLFDRLLRHYKKKGWTEAYGMLSAQGRMHASIGEVSSTLFYESKLRIIDPVRQLAPLQLASPPSADDFDAILTTRRWVYIPSAEAENVISTYHQQEALMTAQLVRRFIKYGYAPDEIGVIAPFRAHGAAILRNLGELREEVSVDTVERYQGSERKVIIYTCGVTHSEQLNALQALNSEGDVDRKLNVAITRAKEQMVVLGCYPLLVQLPHYARLIEYIEEQTETLPSDYWQALATAE